MLLCMLGRWVLLHDKPQEKELNRYVHSAHRIPLEKNSYVDALTPNVTIFGDRAFKEIIKIK